MFATCQASGETIDQFLCRKQLDLLYGLLSLDVKKKIARNDIKNFAELLDKARHLEQLQNLEQATSTKSNSTLTFQYNKVKRCLYCNRKGHVIEICRKRLAEIAATNIQRGENSYTSTPPEGKQQIKCYGCGAPGVFRSNCATCKNKESPVKPNQFYAINHQTEQHARIPTIEIEYNELKGHAYIDTAARTSIAGTKLYDLMRNKGATFIERKTEIKLADGSSKTINLLLTTIKITIGNRILPITFSVIPTAIDNRTLLGIDFLESNGIILNLPQKYLLSTK